MKVSIFTSDQGVVEIDKFDPATIMDFLDGLRQMPAHEMLELDLDGGDVQAFIQKAHIVRVDIEHDD